MARIYIRGIKVSCDSINSCHETNDDLICDVIESNLMTCVLIAI